MGKIKDSDNRSKKRGKSVKSKSSQADIEYNKLKFRFFAAIIAVAVCVPVFWAVSSYVNSVVSYEAEKSESQEKMRNYLRDKYGKEFDVKEPKLTGNALGIKGVWLATAHPIDDGDLLFEVARSESEDEFSDQYTAKMWSQIETSDISVFAWKGAASGQLVTSRANIYLSFPLNKTATPRNPNLANAIRQNDGISYSVKLSYGGVDSSSFSDVVDDAKRITDYIRRDKGVKNLNVEYLVEMHDGTRRGCRGSYYRGFNFSHEEVEGCLNREKTEELEYGN